MSASSSASQGPFKKASALFTRPDRLYDTESWSRSLRRKDINADGPKSTVYTVRISTASDRSSGLDDFDSGMMVCLIGQSNAAVLHRICQIEDSKTAAETMKEVCELVDADAGASCDFVVDDKPRRLPSRTVSRRFQSGAVDEVSFVGPDVGSLRAMLIGPETGAWKLEEVVVSNSRERLTQRFTARQRLGDGGGQGAAFMTPLPPGAVVYGSGEQAVLMTQEQADNMRRLGLKEYTDLKERLLATTAALVAAGVGVSAAAGGAEAAEAFALGGAIAFVYQLLLSYSVDSLPLGAALNGSQYSAPDVLGRQALGASRRDGWLRGLLGSGQARYAITAGAMLATILAIQLWDNGLSGRDAGIHQLSIILTAVLGFATYKCAIIAVTLTPSTPAREHARTIEKL